MFTFLRRIGFFVFISVIVSSYGCSGNGSSPQGSISPSSSAASASSGSSAVSSSSAPGVFVETISGALTTIVTPNGAGANIITTPLVAEVTAGVTPQFPTTKLDASFVNVPSPFCMAETDTTYELWKEVYDWAVSSARGASVYSIANAGQNGSNGNTGFYVAFETSVSTKFPVTSVNWRSAVVWCNAFTEYYNANNGSGTDIECVYYTDSACTLPLRASTNGAIDTGAGSQDNPYIKAGAKGFRLPGRQEYEFAARYIGTAVPSNANYVYKDGVYYYKGDSASGAADVSTNASATALTAVYGTVSTAVVKSKAPNALGLYDMSGNVWKWCFDWYSSTYRVTRGGAFTTTVAYIVVWNVDSVVPESRYHHTGFRFCRNK